MRYLELFESNVPYSFWINTNTKKIIPSTNEHVSYVFDHPEQFGLDKETIQQIKDNVGDGWTMMLMEIVSEQGWVRGGRYFDREFKNGFFLQGYSDEYLWKAAKVLEKQTYFDILALDVFFETHSPQSFTKLYGKELEYWLKTGKYFARNKLS